MTDISVLCERDRITFTETEKNIVFLVVDANITSDEYLIGFLDAKYGTGSWKLTCIEERKVIKHDSLKSLIYGDNEDEHSLLSR